MKLATTVKFNDELIKAYAKLTFRRYRLPIIIISGIIGIITTVISFVGSQLGYGIITLTLTVLVIVAFVFTQRKELIAVLSKNNRQTTLYNFLFSDDEIDISTKKTKVTYHYEDVKSFINGKELVVIRLKNTNVYILNKDCFKKEEWAEIFLQMFNAKKRGK